jgi:asparagine synthase (glutamine-hydrolysing)
MSFWKLHLSDGKWRNAPHGGADGCCHLKGQAYLDEKAIDATKLASELHDQHSTKDRVATLKRLNGFYAWVTEGSDVLMAGVDHVRSYPLFYGQKGGRLFLSDDAEWVRQQVGDAAMDEVARDEFQLTGYVTGQETLFPNVKQLQAGEYLIVRRSPEGIELQTHRYYLFEHTEPEQFDEAEFRDELDAAAMCSIQRLIHYAAGRQIVVPLSGGFDSRLIVTLLKRAGYANVLTFTYGVKDNRESEYSRRVADALGLPWHFEEYTEELWRSAWQSEDRWAYQKWSSGWSSLPLIQDWLAIRIMKQRGIIASQAIFAPGHTGDFISGGHIPLDAFRKTRFKPSDVFKSIFTKHYLLAPVSASARKQIAWIKRIASCVNRQTVFEPWHYAGAFEQWEWQERQAKFICNSVRTYEFFGYDWWMPLWDREFTKVWERTSLIVKKEGRGYLEYVQRVANKSVATLPNAASSRLRLMARRWLIDRSFTLTSIARCTLRRFGGGMSRNLLMPEARFGSRRSRSLYKKGYSVNGIEAQQFLNQYEARENKYRAE